MTRANTVLERAWECIEEDVQYMLALPDWRTAHAKHRYAVAKQEFLSFLEEFAVDWLDQKFKEYRKKQR